MGVVFEGCDEVGELLIGDPAQLADPFTGVDPSTWPCRSSAGATRGSAQYGNLMPQHQELSVLGGRRPGEQDKPVASGTLDGADWWARSTSAASIRYPALRPEPPHDISRPGE